MAPVKLLLTADSLLARIRQSTQACQTRSVAVLGHLDTHRPMMSTFTLAIERGMDFTERQALA
jgi:hypothetical protein